MTRFYALPLDEATTAREYLIYVAFSVLKVVNKYIFFAFHFRFLSNLFQIDWYVKRKVNYALQKKNDGTKTLIDFNQEAPME